MSVNRPTLFPVGEISETSKSTMRVWLSCTVTLRSAMRGVPGTVIVDTTLPGPAGIAIGTLVLVYVVQPALGEGSTLTLRW